MLCTLDPYAFVRCCARSAQGGLKRKIPLLAKESEKWGTLILFTRT